MQKYTVLVVDDSAVMRKKISEFIEGHEQFAVIGKARNGFDALEKIEYLKPDLVILDLEMPELGGLETLKIQMQNNPLPIIVLGENDTSALSVKALGAIEFMLKSDFFNRADDPFKCFFDKKDALSNQLEIQLVRKETVVKERQIATKLSHVDEKILVIGSSTGGPSALQTILTAFPSSINIPVVIVQHMPEGFTKPLAHRFNELCSFLVKEAEQNEILIPGVVYIAPAGLQTEFFLTEIGQYGIHLKKSTNYKTLYKPSIDVALMSLANKAKEHILTVILTGMGDDGLVGCRDVKANGGIVFAEAEESCVVYGMPKVVVKAGLADKELPLHKLVKEIEPYVL